VRHAPQPDSQSRPGPVYEGLPSYGSFGGRPRSGPPALGAPAETFLLAAPPSHETGEEAGLGDEAWTGVSDGADEDTNGAPDTGDGTGLFIEAERAAPPAQSGDAGFTEAPFRELVPEKELSREPVFSSTPPVALPKPPPGAGKPSRLQPGLRYEIPVEGILNQYPDGQYWIIDQQTRDAAETLRATLEEFKIQAEVTGIRKGPVITMFEILPAPGVHLSKIVNLQDNIALRLAASSVRIVAPIPGKHAVGIEVPNKKRNIVSFREIIEGEISRRLAGEGKRLEIPVVLGKDITGEAATVDLVTMPHLLIAGATGSGKSVCVNAMILSILYQRTPAECRLILIDPKIVELKLYNDIPHLLTPVITEPKRAFQALQYCIYEMERR
jgi:DNA segregation ATPase FtsK/SpoIIIE-like protein